LAARKTARSAFGLHDTETAIPDSDSAANLNQQSQLCLKLTPVGGGNGSVEDDGALEHLPATDKEGRYPGRLIPALSGLEVPRCRRGQNPDNSHGLSV
jgi:hypothetical protein